MRGEVSMGHEVPHGGHSQLLREQVVLQIVPISRSTLWRLVKQGKFPQPRKASAGITVWKADEVERWIETLWRVDS